MEADDVNELVRRLFALLTAKCEDGAAIAVEGQGHLLHQELYDRAAKLSAIGAEVLAIADAAVALLEREHS